MLTYSESCRARESSKEAQRRASSNGSRHETKKERDIKKGLRAGTRATLERDMWPSVQKELTKKFIKRLTEGLDTEPADDAAVKQHPIAKQAQAAATHSVSIQDVLKTQASGIRQPIHCHY